MVGGLFLDTLDDEFLIQHVSFATRFPGGQTSSTLDLIVTSDDVQLEDLSAGAPLGSSDHVMICFEYVCSVHIPTSSNRRYLFEKGDYNSDLMNWTWTVCSMAYQSRICGIAFIQYTANYQTNTFLVLFALLSGILHNG